MKTKKTVKIILVVLIGFLALYNLLSAIFTVTGLDSRLGIKTPLFFTVTTGSMEPEMSVGDLLVEWKVPYEDLKPGDDVTFTSNEEFITHRIVRTDGSRLVTMGLANNTEDTSIGPKEYCGKVLFVVPFLGYGYDILTHPLSLVCAVLLVLALFYGNAFVVWAMEKGEKKTEEAAAAPVRFDFGGPLKVSLALLSISVLLTTPLMTEAKYVALLTEYRGVAADTLYMTSNIVSEAGNSYQITGWSGNAKGLTLTVNNYENDTLYNMNGNDLLYGVRLVKFGSDAAAGETYRTEYTIRCNATTATSATEEQAARFSYPGDLETGISSEDLGVYMLTGSDTKKKTDTFDLIVEKNSLASFRAGELIRFRIYVTTSDIHGYLRTMSGDYTLQVAGSAEFVESTAQDTRPGTLLITYNIKTGAVDGSGTRNIKVTWDSDRMYLNEYEQSAYKTLLKYQNADGTYDATRYYRGNGTDDKGFIILPLPAYANVTLQFFKKEQYIDSPNTYFTVEWTEDKVLDSNT